MPKNPLQLVFLIVISNLVPRRTVGSELTSCFAASMATFATLPMVELNVKMAPTCTTAGLEETLLVAPLMNQHGMVSDYVYIINSAGFGGSEKFNETARLRVVAAPRVTRVGRVDLKGAFWICKKV
ncbi:hypothetical protein GW17_00012892 [Ensete ventricosum]|nr:hypothetical protein GW17_00012892 [Ensete ventricosum]